ncbi:dynein assembly factor 5, axonemal isoform X2 [Denticeps clupeoides]|uniref:dynein assembly factor 5, axonemal isoform X2 n=1 Tax=Denticeps clupeoides TaxID=299321 RepID=UPI0010A377FC|nr:dynein assembly factor 5, axonemal isoform X2 [Denticeps clupeoides]
MATGDDGAVAEVLKAVARHVNCLNEGSRASRKRALEAVRRETVDKSLSGAALQRVFSSLLRALLPCLADPMDSCREAAVQLIGDFVRRVPRPEDSLADLMPCLAQRLGSQEAVEPAEELRLALTELLSLTVGLCGKRMAPYLDEVVRILQRTVVDPFPDVKRESCKCAIEFAQSVPEHFHMQAESLVKPLMQTITHQHSRVRVAVIQATGVVVQHGNGRTMDDVLSHLAQRLFDDSPQVRKAVTVVVGDWLLHLKDRYSYFHKLIPLLLSSFSDEIPEIRSLAADLWKQVGAQWEKENEDDLKDKLDFLLTAPPLYPPEVERPGLGCRELVVRNLSRLMPAVSRDMGDWQAGTRLKMAQLLTVLLLHAEDHGTQHLQPLLSTLYHGCTDSVREVHAPCLESAKLLGVFVSPEAFLKLLLEHVENPSTHSASSPWAPLMVLGAVLGGCSRDRLQPHLQPIADTLALPHVCQERQQAEYLQQLLSCVDVLVGVCHHDCGTVSLQLLKVLISVESLANGQPIRDKADECVRALCAVQGVCEVSDLYRLHMPDLLQWLTHTLPSWTSYSIQNTQLQVILLRSGPVVGEFLPLLVPVFQNSLQPDRDPKMKLQLLSTLSELLMDAEHTLDSQRCFLLRTSCLLSFSLPLKRTPKCPAYLPVSHLQCSSDKQLRIFSQIRSTKFTQSFSSVSMTVVMK